MKRILIAVFVGAVAVMCMVIVLTPGHSKRRPMGLAFVGFTNTLGRTEALFWFTNSAETNFSWYVSKMSRRDPTGWVEEPPWTNAGSSRYTPMSSSGVALPGYEDLDLVGLPVWTTNVPVRVVIGSSGLLRLCIGSLWLLGRRFSADEFLIEPMKGKTALTTRLPQ